MDTRHYFIKLAIMVVIILLAWAETFLIKPHWLIIR